MFGEVIEERCRGRNLKKYGLSITQLLTTAGPDRLLNDLAEGLTPQYGDVRIHFYPFGGIGATVLWVREFLAKAAREEGGRPLSNRPAALS